MVLTEQGERKINTESVPEVPFRMSARVRFGGETVAIPQWWTKSREGPVYYADIGDLITCPECRLVCEIKRKPDLVDEINCAECGGPLVVDMPGD